MEAKKKIQIIVRNNLKLSFEDLLSPEDFKLLTIKDYFLRLEKLDLFHPKFR